MLDNKESLNCCGCLEKLLSGAGKFGIGLAAVLGVFKAPVIAEKIYQIQLAQNQAQVQGQNQNQQVTVVVSKEAKQDLERIAEKAQTELPVKIIESIPERPDEEKGGLKGVFILPAYRPAVVKELENAKGKSQKEQILREYFKKSIQMSGEAIKLE